MSCCTAKGLLLILDGVGDRPTAALGGRTPLEAAVTPTLDRLVGRGLCGLIDPLLPGVPVGTHTGTGVLMGLTAAQASTLSRGPVEAAGAGLALQPGDVAIRCNFATVRAEQGGFTLIDRRAGRIRERTAELAKLLQQIQLGEDIHATLLPATQHRAALRLSGPGLSAAVSDTDPGAIPMPGRLLSCYPMQPGDAASERTAHAVNLFIELAHQRLDQHPLNQERRARGALPANAIITRGAGTVAELKSLISHLGLKAALVGGGSTAVGLGRLFNYHVIDRPEFTAAPDTDLHGKVAAAREALTDHDLVFLHIKGTDICAHDRDPLAKKRFIEAVDQALGPLVRDELVIAVTGDHSTDSNSGRHTGDPVPALICAETGRHDRCASFGESDCMQGGLGRISGTAFLSSLLDAMGCLSNFRASDRPFLDPSWS